MENNSTNNSKSLQEDGAVVYAETSIALPDLASAHAAFLLAKNRLLDVNHWQELTSNLLANFQLTDQKGEPIEGPVREGYLFKIDIPGPGTKNGQGFDWVCVEQIIEYAQDDTEGISLVVRPCPNPTSQSQVTSHFYGKEATSTFSVTRQSNQITAIVYDKDLTPNDEAETILDQIRNTVVGVAGILLFSKIQWKTLAERFLSQDDERTSEHGN